VRRELAQLTSPALFDELSAKRLEREFTKRLNAWRDLLTSNPATARDTLRALLPPDQPILFVPEAQGYRLRGATRLGAPILRAAQAGNGKMATPRGFEPRLPP
jgi:hypothetical protein